MGELSASRGTCVLVTGPAGAGKTVVGEEVVGALRSAGRRAELLDEHAVQAWLGPSTGDPTQPEARARLVHVAQLLLRNGVIVVVAAVLPTRAERDLLREELGPEVVEAFVDTPEPLRSDRMANVAGADPSDRHYEEPILPDVRVLTHDRPPPASAAQVVSHLETLHASPDAEEPPGGAASP